jgi:aspartate-semialdehyde dehydrogenase
VRADSFREGEAPMGYRVAILGATGTVGRELLTSLEERAFPVDELRLLTTGQGAGERLDYAGGEVPVQAVTEDLLKGVQILVTSPNSNAARLWGQVAAGLGAMVVDTSEAFRADARVPLVIPEVNPEAVELARQGRIVGSPGAMAISIALALKPLHDAAQVLRVVASTYQSVSGVGRRGVEELERQVADLMNMREVQARAFPHRVAFNVVPQVGPFSERGSTEEEDGLAQQTRKLLGAPDLRMSATAVRVPVYYGHAAALNVATLRKLSADEARALLKKAPGLKLLDDPATGIYPMPMLAVGDAEAHVGRVRDDPSQENGLDLFVAIDNLRKGAALNAVQIAELIRDRGLVVESRPSDATA